MIARRPLWIAYDGVLAGPGHAQVIPYLEALVDRGLRPSLLSWEKPAHQAGRPALAARLRARGIAWRTLRYHRRPALPATAWDLARGLLAGLGFAARERADLVHARSLLSALVAAPIARARGVPWIFDTRGFWAEERVDGGIWPRDGLLHRWADRIERAMVRRADGLVTLTRRAEAILRARGAAAPLRVIPTCVDLERFRPDVALSADARSFAGRRGWLLLGATGTWYLRDAMLDFCRDALADDAEARVALLSPEHHGELRAGLAARGILDRTILRSVPHDEVPGWIAASTAAVLFIVPAPSKAASCPTKLGEILAVGRPVVVNAGVGDVDELVTRNRVGVVLERPGPGAYGRARAPLEALLADPSLASRCRATAAAELSLDKAIDAYRDLYAEVARRRR